jgi:hypothetical protein
MTAMMFCLGLVVGLCLKGIHITVTHKDPKKEAPTEYNPSSANNLPPEMVQYAEKNHGYINL